MSDVARGSPRDAENSPPVVAHVVSCYTHPTENWIRTQIEHLRLYRPVVLTWRAQHSHQEPVEVFSLSEQPRWRSFANRMVQTVVGYAPAFLARVRRSGAVVLHAHFGWTGWATLPLARAAGIPVVTTYYGADASVRPRASPAWRRRYLRLFAEGTLFLVEGPYLGRQLSELGCPADKIRIHRLGVPLARFPFRPRRRGAGEPLRLLCVGRITPKKGFEVAVRAVAAACRTGADCRLTIVGSASGTTEDQETERRLREAVRDAGLDDRVMILGHRSMEDLVALYHEHHVLLAPSVHSEEGDNEGGAPVVVIEAAATGMPAVASRHCDIPDIVRHGESGLLAAEWDVDGLARHILSLADGTKDLVAMGAAARRRIEEHHDADRQADRAATLYDEAVQRPLP